MRETRVEKGLELVRDLLGAAHRAGDLEDDQQGGQRKQVTHRCVACALQREADGEHEQLDRLPDEPRRQIRRLQRLYVEVWVDTLTALRTELTASEARVLAHAAFGLMNSTPFLGGEVDRERRAELLRAATLAALL